MPFIQPDFGKFVQQAKYDLPGSPGSQFVSPDGKRLYVSVRSADSVAAFRIDRADKKTDPAWPDRYQSEGRLPRDGSNRENIALGQL